MPQDDRSMWNLCPLQAPANDGALCLATWQSARACTLAACCVFRELKHLHGRLAIDAKIIAELKMTIDTLRPKDAQPADVAAAPPG